MLGGHELASRTTSHCIDRVVPSQSREHNLRQNASLERQPRPRLIVGDGPRCRIVLLAAAGNPELFEEGIKHPKAWSWVAVERVVRKDARQALEEQGPLLDVGSNPKPAPASPDGPGSSAPAAIRPLPERHGRGPSRGCG